MVWIMLAITMVCVVIVFAIVMVQKEKGTLVKQARAVTKDMVYENAYIVSNDDGRLISISQTPVKLSSMVPLAL